MKRRTLTSAALFLWLSTAPAMAMAEIEVSFEDPAGALEGPAFEAALRADLEAHPHGVPESASLRVRVTDEAFHLTVRDLEGAERTRTLPRDPNEDELGLLVLAATSLLRAEADGLLPEAPSPNGTTSPDEAPLPSQAVDAPTPRDWGPTAHDSNPDRRSEPEAEAPVALPPTPAFDRIFRVGINTLFNLNDVGRDNDFGGSFGLDLDLRLHPNFAFGLANVGFGFGVSSIEGALFVFAFTPIVEGAVAIDDALQLYARAGARLAVRNQTRLTPNTFGAAFYGALGARVAVVDFFSLGGEVGVTVPFEENTDGLRRVALSFIVTTSFHF